MPRINHEDLAATLDCGDAVTLVEELPEPFYRNAHLPGAINIPAQRVPELAPQFLRDLDAEIIVYCANLACSASDLAARALMELGCRHVCGYAERKQGWIDAGLATEKGCGLTAGHYLSDLTGNATTLLGVMIIMYAPRT